jgi:hypothetical protein
MFLSGTKKRPTTIQNMVVEKSSTWMRNGCGLPEFPLAQRKNANDAAVVKADCQPSLEGRKCKQMQANASRLDRRGCQVPTRAAFELQSESAFEKTKIHFRKVHSKRTTLMHTD